ncbi:FecR family protein [Chitinophaga sp. Cy-1792]|uniref:FecR family protein n=1 Tax=Chitinophaga sp. Cy-1792 TaxID=2608339 RepID=UPI00141DFD56|nr:FecR family protein [Chitinophaga sp. Cy-1792]NIG56752.1 DUF4974 domain-containing protein [Chitinophaga sp. Cy-1792]
MEQYSMETRLEALFRQWCDNTIDEKDIPELMQLMQDTGMHQELEKLTRAVYFQQEATPFFTPEQKRKMFLEIVRPADFSGSKIKYITSIAAGIALVIGVSCYLFFSKKHTANTGKILANDIAAPTAAIGLLQLENGNSFHFEDTRSGTVTNQENIKIVKYDDGTIAFNGKTNKPMSGTLTVPKGSKPIRLLLPDSTLVLLNAASGITFPSAFTGNERKVVFYGEAWFEVKHDPAHPFIVKLDKGQVKVLGTHFNIRSYNNDAQTKVTLIEGKVTVNDNVVLKPGQQAVVENNTPNLLKHPDMDEALAWKNNEFNFNGWEVPAILNMLSLWYNFTVEYKSSIPAGHFSGSIKRDNNLSQVLKILETGGLQFEIQKDKLIVY